MAYGKYRNLTRDSLNLYLQEIARIPQINVEKERELGRRIQEDNDQEALKQLVEANLRFVVSFAKKYQNGPLTLPDLIEEGNIGLIEAAKRFDPNKGVKFITYAAWWVRQSIIHALGEKGRTIRLPQRQVNLLYQLGKHYSELKNALNRNPTNEELAENMDITVERATELMKFRNEDLSLDATIDSESNLELKDMLAEDQEPVDHELIMDSLKEQMRLLIGELNEREQFIIEQRFGFNSEEDGKTLQEIGDELGITRERVRQIEQTALNKLRHNRRCRKLNTFLN